MSPQLCAFVASRPHERAQTPFGAVRREGW